MKPLFALGLLLLLLLHLLGQSVAILGLEEKYPVATANDSGDEYLLLKVPLSLPYVAAWQNDDPAGLVQYEGNFYNIVEQRYQNDSLYTVLRSNLTARDQFMALAEQIQQQLHQDTESTPASQTLKVFAGFCKNYLSTRRVLTFFWWECLPERTKYPRVATTLLASDHCPATPPPRYL
ncbi:hypothetical protein GCM10027275_33460 [Rhabdobacter roseus]|uniref:Uncharacterized protein n=1 Tax=Rhabdobacter roseus TaxID=1655419 RepID=A0A840TNX8_9BACT|nr:hypothetical protein [Rhabdobacter roseus]MBB5285431.1 hypothetical protein [Rhabdobacter roseus]